MVEYATPVRKLRIVKLSLFAFVVAASLLGVPLYIYHCGVSAAEIALFLFFVFTTEMAITAGYHRHFAHATYKASSVVRFLLLFFGAAAFEQSARKWASQHRQHHQCTDTEQDPHSSAKGAFHCHVGWLIFYRHKLNLDNVKDLSRSRLVMHQHKYFGAWSITSGIALPMLLGVWIGHPLGAFLLAVCLRLALVMNAAFLINSYAHLIGRKTFDENASARDSWLAALVTNGEGYHSFHHRFPSDYRNGYRWYHWDPTKWLIYVLSRLGLAWGLRRTPREKILAAAAVLHRFPTPAAMVH
jgi:stearoyl-CoA desaturase (delta-9 desaturase)